MATVPEVVMAHEYQLVLIGSAIEAIFLTHPNKEELSKVFRERTDIHFKKLSRSSDWNRKCFDKICLGRDVLIAGITKTTAGG